MVDIEAMNEDQQRTNKVSFCHQKCLWGLIRGAMSYLAQSFPVIIGETPPEDNERIQRLLKKKPYCSKKKTALKIKSKTFREAIKGIF